MSLTGCLSIAFTSYPPDSIQSHSDNPRHLPDIFQTPQNRALNDQSRVFERKETRLLKQYSMFLHWSFINWFGMMTLQAVSRVTKIPFWHLSATFQTLSNLSMLALWRASVGKTVVEYNYTKWLLSMVIPSIQSWQYPGPIWHHLETLQTLSNHLGA